MKRLVLILLFLAAPLWAVEPDEMLDDPALEARAREISTQLRCPVCQNESIDESHAAVARELRIVLRERLVAGDSDAEVLDYMAARFGEFVLMRPRAAGSNLVLWLAAPVLLLVGLGIGWSTIRRRDVAPPVALSDAEKAELEKIIGS
ncbi:cytochrome c-type biogenesis protein CcmH [Yoonia sp. R2331]|uniref:cytochrome c-type biogenesis protein n=1 Tax=Yoonia sp. R2331 TaxID=3237238 RepID=UPI0034E60328